MVLLNALGIQDSGGLKVLKKVLSDCLLNTQEKYLIVCNNNKEINFLFSKYKDTKHFKFHFLKSKSFLFRLYYENVKFHKIVTENNVNLIYNFSGTSQPFLNVKQLIKIQNLLFYTKKIDIVYKQKGKFLLWLKQIYLKRFIFNFMSNHSTYIEVQSSHVKEYMSDFINIENKTFFVKSDIELKEDQFLDPKQYDFTKTIKFLYIVGPHFEYLHKNFIDFTNLMLELEKKELDFEINITLTRKQLESSSIWDISLNKKTNFLGYISDLKEMNKLFCNNTILISTSIIETLGLHVIESIQKGILTVVPDEKYARSVYGKNILTYELFDTKSLLNTILSIIENKIDSEEKILILQNDLRNSERSKCKNIVDIFQKVINV